MVGGVGGGWEGGMRKQFTEVVTNFAEAEDKRYSICIYIASFKIQCFTNFLFVPFHI